MAKKKTPAKKAGTDPKKPASTEDLSDMMSMDEDWEILNLTERTIVRKTPEDEETISLSPPGMEDDDDDEEYTFLADESENTKKAASAADDDAIGVPDSDDADDSLPDEIFELESDEDLEVEADEELRIEAQEDFQVEADEDFQIETDDIIPADQNKNAGQSLEDMADFSELDQDMTTPEADEAQETEDAPKKKKASKQKAKNKKKSTQKKPLIIGIIALLSLVVAGLIVVIAMLLQRPANEPRVASVQTTGRPIVNTGSKPVPTAAPKPVTRPKPVVQPRPTARTTPAPNVRTDLPARPRTAVQQPQPGPATGQKNAAVKPPKPVPSAPAPTPARPQQQPAPPKPAVTKPTASPASAAPVVQPDKNMVHSIQDITFRETGGKLQMAILANGPITDYKSFTLSGPPRLVIDLFGDWTKPPFLEKKAATGYISRIRLGQHDDKLRIVADLRTDQKLAPVFTPTGNGLTINLSIK